MKSGFALIAVLTLMGCSGEPEAEQAEAPEVGSEAAVRENAKSIEQAADEAVKLIEEDAKEDIDASKASEAEAAK